MNEQKYYWKKQTLMFDNNLSEALKQQHHAAQFIAIVGRHLIARQPDDSNTNMKYESEMFIGNEFSGGLHLALQLIDMNLVLLNKNNAIIHTIPLQGKTKNQVFDELKKSLEIHQVDISKLKNELHYEIPAHALDKGAVFEIKDKKYYRENSLYRYNAEVIINEIAIGFKNADPVRIWPHHFDTGFFYPVAQNEKGELSQSIGIGWAIPDSMVNEPYYYLSFWSENSINNLERIGSLDAGEWKMPTWNGAVLKNSEIINAGSAEKQYELVKSFYNSGIHNLKNYFKL